LAALILIGKPIVFGWLMQKNGEAKAVSWEVGVRLGQISEFSLLVIYLALDTKIIQPAATYMVQAATMLTFVGSSYWVTMRYPTPLASSEKLRRD
jgi:predicted Kef-type K+ transport protein